MTHKLHPHTAFLKITRGMLFNAETVEDLTSLLVQRFGSFPILFRAPPNDMADDHAPPGVVITALVHIPGGEERPGPLLGAQIMGYVPAVRGPNGNGQNIVPIGVMKTPAWFDRTRETVVEKPYDGPAPQES